MQTSYGTLYLSAKVFTYANWFDLDALWCSTSQNLIKIESVLDTYVDKS